GFSAQHADARVHPVERSGLARLEDSCADARNSPRSLAIGCAAINCQRFVQWLRTCRAAPGASPRATPFEFALDGMNVHTGGAPLPRSFCYNEMRNVPINVAQFGSAASGPARAARRTRRCPTATR